MNEEQDLRDRISGSLYGLLIGDALGCPIEGMSRAAIAALHKTPLRDMVAGKKRWRPPGLHSDDCQQALAMCDAILHDPENPAPYFVQLLVDLLIEGPTGYRKFGLHRGTGANFRATVMRYKKGENDAAKITAGNGAAMRAAPVALYYRDDEDARAKAVIDIARTTHLDIRGIAAKAAICDVVVRALRHRGLPTEMGYETTIAFTKRVEKDAAAALGTGEDQRFSAILEAVLPHARHDDIDALLQRVEDAAAAGADREVQAMSGFAPCSVTSSLALFFRAESFEDSLIETINLGGDADTTGAMVGQMLGACFGREAIPPAWMDGLLARGVLEDRIDALLFRRHGFRPGFSLVELERPWTALLYAGAPGVQPVVPTLAEIQPGESPQMRSDDESQANESALTPAEEFRQEAVAEKRAPQSDQGGPVPDARADVRDAPADQGGPVPDALADVRDAPADQGGPVPDALADGGPAPTPLRAGAPRSLGQLGLFGAATPAPAKAAPAKATPAKAMPAKATPAKATPQATLEPVGKFTGNLQLTRGDITTFTTEAIVNAANSALRGGGGVDGAIHRAGGGSIMAECDIIRARQGGCRTGSAVITGAGGLPAKYVIHAVGPRWRGGDRREAELLQSAYQKSLDIAKAEGIRSLAFASLSTGVYRFPLPEAARIALHTIMRFMQDSPSAFDLVHMVLFDDAHEVAYQAALQELASTDG